MSFLASLGACLCQVYCFVPAFRIERRTSHTALQPPSSVPFVRSCKNLETII